MSNCFHFSYQGSVLIESSNRIENSYLCCSYILSTLIWLRSRLLSWHIQQARWCLNYHSKKVHKGLDNATTGTKYAFAEWHSFTLFCQQISVFMWNSDDQSAASLQGCFRSCCGDSCQELLQLLRFLQQEEGVLWKTYYWVCSQPSLIGCMICCYLKKNVEVHDYVRYCLCNKAWEYLLCQLSMYLGLLEYMDLFWLSHVITSYWGTAYDNWCLTF